jgi:arsenite/tail-anchored protein-transporting ATPase
MTAPGEPQPLDAPEALVEGATRHLFFTGKGGVGKTSHACAVAVALADAGRSVLLVSTDPASNLAQVLDAPVGPVPVAVPGVPGLTAVNIDPEAATQAYREEALAPLLGRVPEAELRAVEEQLSGACTTEIATFDAFTALLADGAPGPGLGPVDHVVFDTAPTGHTLRLLQLPAAWTGFLERAPGSASCLGPAAGHEAQRRRFERALAELRDPASTTVYLVARPDERALAEAARTAAELGALGVGHHRLIVNGVFRATTPDDPLARALEEEGRAALDALPGALATLPRLETPLRAGNVVGLDALRALYVEPSPAGPSPADAGALPRPEAGAGDLSPDPVDPLEGTPGLGAFLDALGDAPSGLILVMGKGGVGKTSMAAALAVGLADRGHAVHLATTDPPPTWSAPSPTRWRGSG